jgi:hypothetical protein
MRGVGQIVRWLLEKSTIRLDRTRISLLSRLDRFRADFYINDPASAWAIIQDTILKDGLIPAFWRRSQYGYYLAVQPFDTTTPALRIETATGWDRDGGMKRSSGNDVITDATVAYGADDAQGATLRRLTYAPLPATGATPSPYLAAAYGRLRIRRSLEVQADGIQDPGTARLVLDLAVRGRSTTVRSGAYVCQRTGTGAEPGMVVTITDPGLNLSAQLFWITGVQTSTTETRITVESLPDIMRTGAV